MSRIINFCYDDLGSNPDLGYPNLAAPGLGPEDFDVTYPRVLPLRFLMYLQQFGYRFQAHLVESAPLGSWYPVALAWHDFDCNYFDLISLPAKIRAQQGDIKFLFYYHEGDHPGRIKDRFDQLCIQHRLPDSCYRFISANSSADSYENFLYFSDHEYFLGYINRRQSSTPATHQPRPFEFTAVNRLHKWWRSSVMSDLHAQGLLDHSLWSYNTSFAINGDRPEDNPLALDSILGWRETQEKFLSNGPYVCDSNNVDQHNDHRHINTDLYSQSYCHLVIETLFDADQSGGTFLTEKTYKCMKFGQPFVIVGPVGSLQVLRDSGYRVFDHMIDNSYDKIIDNTERWLAVKKSILDIKTQDMHQWYLGCLDDVLHNQWMFTTKSHAALDRLVQTLTEHRHAI